MTTATPPTRPGPAELAGEMTDAASGVAMWTTTLFGIVPGFLPTVALTIVGLAIIVVPVLIVGAGLGAAFTLLLVFGRLVSRGFSLVARDRHEIDVCGEGDRGMARAEPEAALH
jgi:hypothetical protein